jgi:cytochrome c2
VQETTVHFQQIVRGVWGVGALLLLGACQPQKPATPTLDGGNPKQGKMLLAQYQCGSCHRIPDVESARGLAGPSLERFALRSYLAGRWPNRQEALVRWISAPQAMAPGTLMPDMGVSPEDARHMAAYLYTLR